MNYRSTADLHRAVTTRLAEPARNSDLIVGIPRSGLLAASMLALHVNRPLADLDGYLAGREIASGLSRSSSVKRGGGEQHRRVLVVDDSVYQGTEMARAKQLIAQIGIDDEVAFAAVFVAPGGERHVDFWCEICRQPRAFEWNLFHSSILKSSCMDIDGVLCDDPAEGIDDDGDSYRQFVANAAPKLIPTVPVANLVTCRLEKYRDLTEQWLHKHGVEYDALHMMQYDSAAERRAKSDHAKFKADVFQKTSSEFFIESSVKQSEEIAGITGKAVFCVDVNGLIEPPLMPRLRTAMVESPTTLKMAVKRRLRRLRIAMGLPPRSQWFKQKHIN